MSGRPGRVILKPRRARPFLAGHPWVYTHSVARVEGSPAVGDEVDLIGHEGRFIARGLYNPASTICTRLYLWEDGDLGPDFWRRRLASAVLLRSDVLGLNRRTTAFRLVNSEGDGLSGLTIDRYDRWLVAQFSSLALLRRRELFLELLMEQTGAEGILARPDRGVAEEEGLDRQDVQIVGSIPLDPLVIRENGLDFEVNLAAGQKTGFYCDQRENRLLVASCCGGRRVLDLFCYSGGFSLAALKHGAAESTLGIDSSATAIEQARRNAGRNGLDRASFECGDVVKVLDRLARRGQKFDVVICDPPKYARHAGDLDNALKGYLRLNLAALGVLAPGGILATCSCSGLVDRRMFMELLAQVSEASKRTVQILEQRGQAADHPVSAACPESDYLKCFLCRVDGR